ncbi:MAG: Holliday junction resolvase Hjc [Nanoarchaeota archaeon]
MSKSKGSRAERELLNMFWETGLWGGYRSAGSGSTPLPSPDLLVGNGKRYLAIECKSLKSKSRYLEPQQIKELIEFSKIFGAEPWIGLRFNNIGWYFIHPKKLKKTKNGNLIASLELLEKNGLNFEKLIKL